MKSVTKLIVIELQSNVLVLVYLINFNFRGNSNPSCCKVKTSTFFHEIIHNFPGLSGCSRLLKIIKNLQQICHNISKEKAPTMLFHERIKNQCVQHDKHLTLSSRRCYVGNKSGWVVPCTYRS